jgi:penicillin amidase
VGATLYAAWRSAMIRTTFDSRLSPFTVPDADIYYSPGESVVAALRNLLDNFAQNHGVGASGIDFFSSPPLPVAEDRRDVVILSALASALDALAGDDYAAAFDHSTTLDDYRWGKLHRLTLPHPLGAPFSIPPAGGAFPSPLPGIAGIPVDGGYATVDVASHVVRARSAGDYHFEIGAARRFVSEAKGDDARNESIWPGGTSGVLGRPAYLTFLTRWLANIAIPVSLGDSRAGSSGEIQFRPARK